MSVKPLISVIIPVLDEEQALPLCLTDLAACEGPLEILVVDGGSRDRTTELVRAHEGVRLLVGGPGRAAQMNHGARAAQGEILWFLHADSRVQPTACAQIRNCLASPEVALGAFRFAVDSPRQVYRMLEIGVRLRIALFRLPYGDQGFFLQRSTFEAAGGFEEIPIMEDTHLVRRLRRMGQVRVLPEPLRTSARRWERGGFLGVTVRNVLLACGDRLGISPQTLASSRLARAGGGKEHKREGSGSG